MPSPIYRSRNLSSNPIVPEQDPLDALSTFFEGAPLSDGGPATPDEDNPPPAYDNRRNNVRVDLLRKQLGMGPDPLDSVRDSDPTDPLTQRRSHSVSLGSQQELEDAADQQHREQASQEHEKHLHTLQDFFLPQAEEQRAALQKDKMEPINAQGQTARDVATINSQGDIDKQRVANEAKVGVGGFGGDNPTVQYWAEQAMRDSSFLTKIPAAQRPAIEAQMAHMGGTPGTPTNQEKQMSETANDVLDVLDTNGYEDQARGLSDQGLFAPGIGSVRRWAAQHGLGTLFGMGDDTAQKIGQFETLHGLLISAIQRAHAGARGAGNSDMAARFEKLLADQGDLPTFLGGLTGMRALLGQYASHTNPNRARPAAAGADPDDLGAAWGGR